MEFWWKTSNLGEEMSEFGEKCWDFGAERRQVLLGGKYEYFHQNGCNFRSFCCRILLGAEMGWGNGGILVRNVRI